jgi:hypothetical protein
MKRLPHACVDEAFMIPHPSLSRPGAPRADVGRAAARRRAVSRRRRGGRTSRSITILDAAPSVLRLLALVGWDTDPAIEILAAAES